MSKFNRPGVRPTVSSPVKTEATPSTSTYEGGPGYVRDAKGELFLLAVANMVGEGTFYEKAQSRDDRFCHLVHQLAVEDPGWTFDLLLWLRSDGNMRTASLVGAAEYVKARLDAAGTRAGRQHETKDRATEAWEGDSLGYVTYTNRKVIDAVLQRADEPGEMLAYWTSKYGRNIPQPVKRGIADAVRRMYNEYGLAKYDSDAKGFRFGDVLDLVHPSPDGGKAWQGDLFEHALDRRHSRDNPIPESLPMLRARAALLALPVAERRPVLLAADGPDRLKAAGITWEALAGWLQGPMDAAAWSAVIPSMGYMARLRNLRNWDEAGVSDEVAEKVAAELADPERVAKSRQFPFRFYSAYLAAPSLRWGHALDKALTHSTRNIPVFMGRTLVLVDTSGSMGSRVSDRSQMTYAQMAALFGVSLAARGNGIDLVGFADGAFRHQVAAGGSVLREVERFCARIGEVGHGTQIAESLRATYAGHERVVILSDMQTFGSYYGNAVTNVAPANVPIYAFNLAGYKAAAMPSGSGNRHELGGMTDAAFRLVPLLEAGQSGDWPWRTPTPDV